MEYLHGRLLAINVTEHYGIEMAAVEINYIEIK
jgi:hypothetical protein